MFDSTGTKLKARIIKEIWITGVDWNKLDCYKVTKQIDHVYCGLTWS